MMGGGASSILAMIQSDRYNESLRRKRSILKQDRSPYAAQKRYLKPSTGYIFTRALRQAELDEIKARHKKLRRASRIRAAIAGVMVFVVMSVLVFFSVLAFDGVANGLSEEQVRNHFAKKKRFAFFMNDGGRYLEQGHFHNAQFQFNEAMQLYPTNFDAQYRYCLAVNYWCMYEQTNCEEADQLLDEMLKKYPENKMVQNLADAQFKVLGDAADTGGE